MQRLFKSQTKHQANIYESEDLWSYRAVNNHRLPIHTPFCPREGQHAPPAQPELSEIFTIKVIILCTRNERAPAWPLDSGISLMNWTTKPCWYKEEVFRILQQTQLKHKRFSTKDKYPNTS